MKICIPFISYKHSVHFLYLFTHIQYTFSPQKLSYNLLSNSFDIIPQCNLVFHPTTKPGKSSFFVVMALTHEPSSTTVMYASTAIKKVVTFIVNTAITLGAHKAKPRVSFFRSYNYNWSISFSIFQQCIRSSQKPRVRFFGTYHQLAYLPPLIFLFFSSICLLLIHVSITYCP